MAAKVPRMKIETTTSQAGQPAQPEAQASPVAAPTSSRAQAPRPKLETAPASPAPKPATPAPKPKVAPAPASQQEPADPAHLSAGPASEPASSATGGAEERPGRATPLSGTRDAATGWVHRTFPGHENAFWCGVGALALALLVFAIGFLRVLFVCVLVVMGVALGQVLDGDPKIIRTIRELISSNRGEE